MAELEICNPLKIWVTADAFHFFIAIQIGSERMTGILDGIIRVRLGCHFVSQSIGQLQLNSSWYPHQANFLPSFNRTPSRHDS